MVDKKDDDDVVFQVRDTATFIGQLYSISGNPRNGGVRAKVNTDTYGVVFCDCTLDLGIALRDFLFEQVKVSGRGLWKRVSDGQWRIDGFTITDYQPVSKENLRSTVDAIRGMHINWPDDPIGEIIKFEKDGEAIN